MRIEFDPTNRDEATAVRAVLAALHPEAKKPLPGITDPENDDPEELERVEAEVKELLAAPDVDANNEPHDPRIHSSPPKTNADGTWRAKRGVTADVVAAVRAEREAQTPTVAESGEVLVNGEPTGVTVVSDPETGMVTHTIETANFTVADPNGTIEEQIEEGLKNSNSELVETDSGVKVVPSAPPAPPPAPTVPGPVGIPGDAPSFLDVMKAITAAQKDGKIDTAKVKELCAAVGAGESTMGLNGPDNADKRSAFMALLGETING